MFICKIALKFTFFLFFFCFTCLPVDWNRLFSCFSHFTNLSTLFLEPIVLWHDDGHLKWHFKVSFVRLTTFIWLADPLMRMDHTILAKRSRQKHRHTIRH